MPTRRQTRGACKVTEGDQVMKVRWHVPLMGYVVNEMGSRSGKTGLAAFAAIFIAANVLQKIWRRSGQRTESLDVPSDAPLSDSKDIVSPAPESASVDAAEGEPVLATTGSSQAIPTVGQQ